MVAYWVQQTGKLRRLVPGFLCLLLPLFLPNQAAAWKGGEGAADVSGYRILHQTYRLSPEEPTLVVGILFDVVGETAPHRVFVKIGDVGTWFNCRLISTASLNRASVQCEVGGIPVESLQDLMVVATGG